MKYLKRLAVLALPVVAVMSLGTTANASSAPMSYIYNKPENAIGIGVSWGVTPENYQAILPAGQRTDRYLGWQGAHSFYIGPGYCADPYYYQNGGWHWYGVTVRGPRKFVVKTVITGETTARNEVRDNRPC